MGYGMIGGMGRILAESYVVSDAASPLKVDEQAGIIYGVKVLGRYSRNRYVPESEGTEYAPHAMRKALPLYEGADVLIDHPDPKRASAPRSSDDVFGQLREARFEGDCVRADLHYLRSHPMAGRVVEDVTRGLGVFGLSHNATADKERYDQASKRLVIESIASVRSVDLVNRPATGRNLWESEQMADKAMTMRSVLESRLAGMSKSRQAWAKRLLEMDDMPEVDAPVETPAADTDPEAALSGGFRAACLAVIEAAIRGDMDTGEALKKLKELLTTHNKLAGDGEPEPPSESSAEDTNKAEQEREELAMLRREKKARELCDQLGFVPTAVQLEAIAALTPDKARQLIESFKADGAAKPSYRVPRSAPPTKARDVAESEWNPAEDLYRLRNH